VKGNPKVAEKLEKLTKQTDEEAKSIDLAIIEEEAHNEDARSQFSKRIPTVQGNTNSKNNGP
jgi:outer membrane protein TolC